ncbi:hypothetical protein BpHYR1_010755 [Brachionus plicatilis]|uniref:Uncharacterized protein n=1 Tax=Brachionus plicatilis TaxID=10195 RepID=A0A3M7S0X8_BRAPC|nr:hypothetical protein BpHYR1_010755 [Brachionus plicatilis]
MVFVKILFTLMVLVAIAMANENNVFEQCTKLVNRFSSASSGQNFLESGEEKLKVNPDDLLDCLSYMYELAIKLDTTYQNIDDSPIIQRDTRRLKQFWKRKASWLKNNKKFW